MWQLQPAHELVMFRAQTAGAVFVLRSWLLGVVLLVCCRRCAGSSTRLPWSLRSTCHHTTTTTQR
jgi:hypothetical protein